MKGKMTIIKSTGEITEKEYSGPIPLGDFQKAVGGYIELIPYFNTYRGMPCRAFCNEYGKVQADHLPYNMIATALWVIAAKKMNHPDYLVGDIAIVTGDQAFLNSL